MSELHHIDLGRHSIAMRKGGEGPGHFTCLHGLVDTAEVWRKLDRAAPR